MVTTVIFKILSPLFYPLSPYHQGSSKSHCRAEGFFVHLVLFATCCDSRLLLAGAQLLFGERASLDMLLLAQAISCILREYNRQSLRGVRVTAEPQGRQRRTAENSESDGSKRGN